MPAAGAVMSARTMQQVSSPRPARRCTFACQATASDASHRTRRGATGSTVEAVARSCVAALAASALSLAVGTSSVQAADPVVVQELFTKKCAGCHMGGGNVLAVGATLFAPDLEKNGISSPEALYKIIYSGKAKMPGYGTDCAPKGACTFGPRLSDEQVQDLADYVQRRAAEGWKE